MSRTADIAQRIAANACSALQIIRDGHTFPSTIYSMIESDCALIMAECGQKTTAQNCDIIVADPINRLAMATLENVDGNFEQALSWARGAPLPSAKRDALISKLTALAGACS